MMLDAHPDLAVPFETHFLQELILCAHLDITKGQFFQIVTEAPSWPNLGLEATVLSEALDALDSFSVPEAIRTFYRLCARRFGKLRWGDKTPPYRSCMVGIQQLLPEAHFIHIIRDGRDTALSYKGLWFGPGDDIEVQARFWVEQVNLARRQSTELRRYMEVSYERLVEDPGGSLESICNFLDLPFDPQMLNYYKFAPARLADIKQPFGPPGQTPTDIERFIAIHEHTKRPLDPGRIGRWRTEMPEDQQQRYEAIAGGLLRELEYETRFGCGAPGR
jgi:hypothetical protein